MNKYGVNIVVISPELYEETHRGTVPKLLQPISEKPIVSHIIESVYTRYPNSIGFSTDRITLILSKTDALVESYVKFAYPYFENRLDCFILGDGDSILDVVKQMPVGCRTIFYNAKSFLQLDFEDITGNWMCGVNADVTPINLMVSKRTGDGYVLSKYLHSGDMTAVFETGVSLHHFTGIMAVDNVMDVIELISEGDSTLEDVIPKFLEEHTVVVNPYNADMWVDMTGDEIYEYTRPVQHEVVEFHVHPLTLALDMREDFTPIFLSRRMKHFNHLYPEIIFNKDRLFVYPAIGGTRYRSLAMPYNIKRTLDWLQENLWAPNMQVNSKVATEVAYDFYMNDTYDALRKLAVENPDWEEPAIINEVFIGSADVTLAKTGHFKFLFDVAKSVIHGQLSLDCIVCGPYENFLLYPAAKWGNRTRVWGDVFWDLATLGVEFLLGNSMGELHRLSHVEIGKTVDGKHKAYIVDALQSSVYQSVLPKFYAWCTENDYPEDKVRAIMGIIILKRAVDTSTNPNGDFGLYLFARYLLHHTNADLIKFQRRKQHKK